MTTQTTPQPNQPIQRHELNSDEELIQRAALFHYRNHNERLNDILGWTLTYDENGKPACDAVTECFLWWHGKSSTGKEFVPEAKKAEYRRLNKNGFPALLEAAWHRRVGHLLRDQKQDAGYADYQQFQKAFNDEGDNDGGESFNSLVEVVGGAYAAKPEFNGEDWAEFKHDSKKAIQAIQQDEDLLVKALEAGVSRRDILAACPNLSERRLRELMKNVPKKSR